MAQIIDLEIAKRKREHPDYDGLVCDCGSAWFIATVSLRLDGGVNGISPSVVCTECSEEIGLKG